MEHSLAARERDDPAPLKDVIGGLNPIIPISIAIAGMVG
jgi:hypothetical protein